MIDIPTGLAAVIGAVLVLLGGLGGNLVAARSRAHETRKSAESALIDQLQEELTRYRERTDRRLDTLEAENRGYRAFIGVQRDHMAEHGIPLPPWPAGLPR